METRLPIPKARPEMPAVKPTKEGPFYVIFYGLPFGGVNYVTFDFKNEAKEWIREAKREKTATNIVGPLAKI